MKTVGITELLIILCLFSHTACASENSFKAYLNQPPMFITTVKQPVPLYRAPNSADYVQAIGRGAFSSIAGMVVPICLYNALHVEFQGGVGKWMVPAPSDNVILVNMGIGLAVQIATNFELMSRYLNRGATQSQPSLKPNDANLLSVISGMANIATTLALIFLLGGQSS